MEFSYTSPITKSKLKVVVAGENVRVFANDTSVLVPKEGLLWLQSVCAQVMDDIDVRKAMFREGAAR
jgi:hypothetical protein